MVKLTFSNNPNENILVPPWLDVSLKKLDNNLMSLTLIVSLAGELVSKWMKSGCSFFSINMQFLHCSQGCWLPSVHKYIFPSEEAVSATVEVAELKTKIAEGLFFKTG